MTKTEKTAEWGVVVITSDMSVSLVPLDEPMISLYQLYEWTKCDCIQIIRSQCIKDICLCIDDNGKVHRRRYNTLATMLYAPNADFIVGDVVIGTLEKPFEWYENDMYALPYEKAKKLYADFNEMSHWHDIINIDEHMKNAHKG